MSGGGILNNCWVSDISRNKLCNWMSIVGAGIDRPNTNYRGRCPPLRGKTDNYLLGGRCPPLQIKDI